MQRKYYGVVALELANSEVFFLDRLAVLSDQRKKGFGKALVNQELSKERDFSADCLKLKQSCLLL